MYQIVLEDFNIHQMKNMASTWTTTMYALLLFAAILPAISYPQTIESDETELLKCKVEALEKTVADMKGKMETMERRELQQNISLKEVKIQSSKLSTFCSVLPDNVCGDCR